MNWLVRALERKRIHPNVLLGADLTPPTSAGELQWMAWKLERAAIDWTKLAPLLSFRCDRYQRRILHLCRDWELVLISWLPGQASAIHGHGTSHGAARVLCGTVRETKFEKPPEEGQALQPVGSRSLCAGEVLTESPGDVHRVENISAQPAVTLHLYSPPLATPRRQRIGLPFRRRERALPQLVPAR